MATTEKKCQWCGRKYVSQGLFGEQNCFCSQRCYLQAKKTGVKSVSPFRKAFFILALLAFGGLITFIGDKCSNKSNPSSVPKVENISSPQTTLPESDIKPVPNPKKTKTETYTEEKSEAFSIEAEENINFEEVQNESMPVSIPDTL